MSRFRVNSCHYSMQKRDEKETSFVLPIHRGIIGTTDEDDNSRRDSSNIVCAFDRMCESEFEIFFDNSGWNSDLYRRFGINVRGKSVRAILWQGSQLVRGENLSGNPRLEPGLWYTLALAAGKNGDLIAQLWDPAEPAETYRFRDKLGENRTELPWVFGIAANKGKVLIDSFVEIGIGEIR